MDSYIDARFERVEKALATLIESITKYTPQTPQALELASADRELNSGLLDLQTHQNNHARIVALQSASDALDSQIRDTLRLLWNMRKDITSTHVTKFSDGPSYDVNWEELLGYARRISKTTLPAPSILISAAAASNGGDAGGVESIGEITGDAVNTPNTTAAPTPAPGAATPVGNGAVTPAAHTQHHHQQQQQQQVQPPAQQTNGTALPDEWARFLDPLTDQTFYPWPTEEKIRMGALASIQALIDQGIDPSGFDPAEEEARRQREEEMRRDQEEKEAAEREENLRRMREEQARIARERQRERERAQEEAARRGSSGASVPAPAATASGGAAAQPAGGASTDAAKKQFHFMGDDDDDDED